MKPCTPALALLALLSVAACGGTPAAPEPVTAPIPDVPIARPPYESVPIEWKHRLDQGYVFVEHVGDYREVGDALRTVGLAARDQRIEPTGPAFVLYYDDPGKVAVDSLRSRACVPVSGEVRIRGPLSYDVLAGGPVIYALVAGPYRDVPRSYPAFLAYLAERGWTDSGPWRQIYLNAGEADEADLVTEVQVPWTVTD
jgi:effector-binding domain-containing protein